ncbi:MAG TPA: NTP transferase domain-containing protein [Chthoniobacterales bacterium]
MRRVAAVILAAGGSSRLGQPKQLLTFRGETLVRRAARAATEAGCDPVVVVIGETSDAIRAELPSVSSIVVENQQWQLGPGTSIRHGVGELPDSVDAVVLLACDQPFVEAAVVRRLIDEHEKSGRPIVASSYANTLGVPALFGRSCFEALLTLPESAGAKSLILSRRRDVTAVKFEEGSLDIDTAEDAARLATLSKAEDSVTLADMVREQDNIALVQSLYAAFGRGDIETIIGALAEDIEWSFPGPRQVIPFAGTHRGIQEVVQFFVTLSEALEFQKFEPQHFIADGDNVVVIGISRVRNKASERATDNEWVAVITARNGKIARYQLYEDTDALAAIFR